MAAMVAILKIFKPHLLLNTKSDLTQTMGGIRGHGDSALLKSFHSDIQDGWQLEILQTTSPDKQ